MSQFISLTQDEFERMASDVIGVIVAEATDVMQQKLQQAGFVLTGELLNSLRHQAIIQGRNLYAEFSIGFSGYGRFKDMKQLLYGKMPPIEMMEEFVREIGVENFKYTPGYLTDAKRRVQVPDGRAINRIAWGIAISRMKNGVKGKRKNAFYNPVRGKLIYETGRKMLDALPEPILQALKAGLER